MDDIDYQAAALWDDFQWYSSKRISRRKHDPIRIIIY